MSGFFPNPAGVASILNGNVFPSAAMDVVAVFDKDFIQVFKNARPQKVTIKPTVKLMEQPVETGVVITDHRVIQPLEIELSLIFRGVNYRDTYQEIWDLKNKSTILTVQTHTRTFDNMVIMEMPSDESTDMYNTVTMALKLREVLFSTPQFGLVPKNPANSNTQNRGQLQPTDASAPKQSAAASLLDKFK